MARYPLIFPARRVVPVAVVVAAAGAGFSPSLALRILCGAFGAVAAALAWWQARARTAVIVDERGYAVEERGQEKLRVAWSEVVRVRADGAERALYVDCGEPARNLLVPPRRGYGFRFERSEALYAQILDAVAPEKIELVTRLDAAVQKK